MCSLYSLLLGKPTVHDVATLVVAEACFGSAHRGSTVCAYSLQKFLGHEKDLRNVQHANAFLAGLWATRRTFVIYSKSMCF